MAVFANCKERGKTQISDPDVYSGIEFLENKNFNMFDTKESIQVLRDNGYDETADWIPKNLVPYVCGVKNGFEFS